MYTKTYLDLKYLEDKEKEARRKAGKNVTESKEFYKKRGLESLKRYDILNFMHLAESEEDMANLTRMVEDFLGHTGDLKDKTNLVCKSIQTCYLRRNLKYSRLLSGGAFFQTFDKNPIAISTQFQLEYDHGHYQELVDKYKQLTKVENAAQMTIVMAALCRLGTPEAYKQATEFRADEFLIPKEVESSRAFELFAWFSIQMGHYDAAIETLKKKKQPTNFSDKIKSVKASTKIRANIILFALMKSDKVDICLSEMDNALKNYTKFGFTPVYSSEVIQGLAEAVKHDKKLIKKYKELQKDLEEKGKVEKATVEVLVFRPIDGSPHSVASDLW